MSLLLDTQAFLWFLLDDKRLSTLARTTIERTEILYLSPASHWEIAIKIALGKYALPEPYTPFMERELAYKSDSVTRHHIICCWVTQWNCSCPRSGNPTYILK